jgi:hypothetical protein
MAAWQFDMHLLPAEAARRRYGATPLMIPRSDHDEGDWWKDQERLDNLPSEISKLLPTLSSWSNDLQRWGTEDGDRVDLLCHGRVVVDILVRVDVRDLSHTFVAGVMDMARRHGWCVRLASGRVIAPSTTKVLAAIRDSDAFRFVRDPAGFLALLSDRVRREPKDEG